MFKNLSIKSRLVFVIGFLSTLLVGIGVLGLTSLHATNDSMKTVYEDRVVGIGQLEKISALININQLLVAESVASQLSAFPEDISEVDKRVVELKAGITEIDSLWKAFTSHVETAEGTRLAKEFDANRKKYGGSGLMPAIAALSGHDFQQAGEVLQGPMIEAYPAVRNSVVALIKLQLEVAKGEYEASQARFVTVEMISVALIMVGIVLAGLMGFWLIRAISHPLNEAVRIAQRVAAGDLTQRIEVHSNDETGQLMHAMQDMQDSLVNIVGRVRTGTETIAVASREIASGNADLSNRTESQASSLEET
ncbi:MAG: Tar ligand binding domain-containing protein, partial [Thiobacillus sp.]